MRSDVWSIWSFGNSTLTGPLVCLYIAKYTNRNHFGVNNAPNIETCGRHCFMQFSNSNICLLEPNKDMNIYTIVQRLVFMFYRRRKNQLRYSSYRLISSNEYVSLWIKYVSFFIPFAKVQLQIPHLGYITIAMKPFMRGEAMRCDACVCSATCVY